ncbi:hypothetical protein Glove_54g152 [Diversispora epigaea]|uniref:Restriction endonuclease type IV Mrr domain-containing protein n=1 Tax=Diversispora epigaea TaxID=1348612 RepID=A0A397JCK6_9GLOM|nr:hypothetical protein Glove_54g152 [Diversispora epigaea]
MRNITKHPIEQNNESENSNVNYESSEEIHEVKKRKNKEIEQDKFERQLDKPYKLINHINDRAFNEAFKDNKDDLVNFLKLLIVYRENKQDIYKKIRLELLKKNSERSAEFCKWRNDIFDMSQQLDPDIVDTVHGHPNNEENDLDTLSRFADKQFNIEIDINNLKFILKDIQDNRSLAIVVEKHEPHPVSIEMTSIEKGNCYEFEILQLLRDNGIECNATRTSHDNKFTRTSHDNKFIDLKCKVGPKDIREFTGTVHKQPEGTIGIFVTNTLYTDNAENEARNSKRTIILCNENNLIESIKLALKEYKAQFEKAPVIEEFVIENIEFNEFDKIDIYGIVLVGRCKIGCIKVKHNIMMTEMWFNIFSLMNYDNYSKFSTLNFSAYKAYHKKINIRQSLNYKTDILCAHNYHDISVCLIKKVTKRKDRDWITLEDRRERLVNRKIKYEKNLPYIKIGSNKYNKKDGRMFYGLGKDKCRICGKVDYLSSGYISNSKCSCERDYSFFIKSSSYSTINLLKYYYHHDVCVGCLEESISEVLDN